MNQEPPAEIEEISVEEAQTIIRHLNALDLDEADFDEIYDQVAKFKKGIQTTAVFFDPSKQPLIYRGRKSKDKLNNISELGAPSSEKTNGFQRCNGPASPMFYAARSPLTVLLEIDASSGETVFVAQWLVTKPIVINKSLEHIREKPKLSGPAQPVIETKFSQPVHET